MTNMSDYRAPAASTSEDTKVGWLSEIVSQGEQWLKQQRPYASIDEAPDPFSSPGWERYPGTTRRGAEADPEDMSRVGGPPSKGQLRELVSILSNLRPTAANKTDNTKYYEQ